MGAKAVRKPCSDGGGGYYSKCGSKTNWAHAAEWRRAQKRLCLACFELEKREQRAEAANQATRRLEALRRQVKVPSFFTARLGRNA